MITTLRAITLRVSSFILERTVELFYTLRNELTAEDLRKNASVLQQSPAVNTLLPYCLANLDGLDEPKVKFKETCRLRKFYRLRIAEMVIIIIEILTLSIWLRSAEFQVTS